MTEKNIEKLKVDMIDSLLNLEVALSKLDSPKKGENYPLTLQADIKKSIQEYELIKRQMEDLEIDVSVFEERVINMKKEYNYLN